MKQVQTLTGNRLLKISLLVIAILMTSALTVKASNLPQSVRATPADNTIPGATCDLMPSQVETGSISRLQIYVPPFHVCGLDYVGAVTVRASDGEKYKAFVTPVTHCTFGIGLSCLQALHLSQTISIDYVLKRRKSERTGILENIQ